jgi:hypothetical protein
MLEERERARDAALEELRAKIRAAPTRPTAASCWMERLCLRRSGN